MLRYLIAVTEGLAMTAVLTGLLYAYIRIAHTDRSRRVLTYGTAAGFAAAVVMAILKNTTSLIHTGVWNVRIFTLSLAALVLFAALSLPRVKRRTGGKGERLFAVCAAVLAFTWLVYAFPDVLAYPFTFSLNGAALLSTDFLYRLIGWALGLILMLLLFFGVLCAGVRAGGALCGTLLGVALGINALQQMARILQVLVTRRILRGHGLFTVARYTSNYGSIFLYAVLIAALILPASLLLRSLNVREPYENPAQHRKIRAAWRSARRWSCVVLVCCMLTFSNMTWVKAMSSREVELSPVEQSEVRGDNVYIPLEQVEDGHLHRFAYTTESGTAVRFIVIRKPGSFSYGVGLDACDICGETGYYERDGQIVCKLCDVVMNINTIGFKGGCNPIVIDYSVENGYIIVPTYTLVEHENEFQ